MQTNISKLKIKIVFFAIESNDTLQTYFPLVLKINVLKKIILYKQIFQN